jgi:hypothetical protein
MVTFTQQPTSPLEELTSAETNGSVFDENGSNSLSSDSNSLDTGSGNMLD